MGSKSATRAIRPTTCSACRRWRTSWACSTAVARIGMVPRMATAYLATCTFHCRGSRRKMLGSRKAGPEPREMTVSLTGRVALVTGGAHRVGKAIVLALANQRMRIALHYGGSADAARATEQEVRQLGAEVRLFQADLRDASAAPRLIDDVV